MLETEIMENATTVHKEFGSWFVFLPSSVLQLKIVQINLTKLLLNLFFTSIRQTANRKHLERGGECDDLATCHITFKRSDLLN